MKKITYILLGIMLSVILFLVFSPKTEGISNNPCSPCHPFPNGAFDQYLDILEGDVQTQIPSSIDKGQIKTVSVIIENGGSPGIYDKISGVSLSLASQYDFFSVDSQTIVLGDLYLGKKSAVWTITGLSDGNDIIVVSVIGTNQHGASQFTDSYSTPISVGEPTTTPTPTPTINQLSVIFQSPKEDDRWLALATQNIVWLINGGRPPLRITLEYLTSNISEHWISIATNIANNGSLTWEIPNINGTLNLRITAFDSSSPPQTAIALVNIQVAEPISEFTTIIMPIILMGVISLIIIKRTSKQKKPSNRIY